MKYNKFESIGRLNLCQEIVQMELFGDEMCNLRNWDCDSWYFYYEWSMWSVRKKRKLYKQYKEME